MAIRDALTTFGENQDLDTEADIVTFTNQIDLGVAGRDPGQGQPVYLNFVVTEAFTDGGDSATLQLTVASDDSATINETTATEHLKTPLYLKAALPLGAIYSFQLPSEGTVYERYLGLRAEVATAGFDAGMITAWLSPDPVGTIKKYADATN
jgi:Bbp16